MRSVVFALLKSPRDAVYHTRRISLSMSIYVSGSGVFEASTDLVDIL